METLLSPVILKNDDHDEAIRSNNTSSSNFLRNSPLHRRIAVIAASENNIPENDDESVETTTHPILLSTTNERLSSWIVPLDNTNTTIDINRPVVVVPSSSDTANGQPAFSNKTEEKFHPSNNNDNRDLPPNNNNNPDSRSFYSRSTIMDTVAHSRKTVSRLSVPTGGDVVVNSLRGKSSTRTTTTTSSSTGGHALGFSATSPNFTWSAWQYWSRLTDLRQMDLQSALDQMKSLLSLRPHVVYKTSYYRKQTKNHWARDDPAFLFLQAVFLIIATVAYSVAFRISWTGAVSFLLYTVVWNWLGMGIALATLCREIANRQLIGQQTATSNSHVRQQVEWLYAFDIHCNSFFPVFVVLYGLQFFLLPLVLGEGWLPLLLANTMYALALSWYWYITHLGYRSLPFLGNTEVFLFPIAAILVVFAISLVGYPLGFGWNAARVMARFYFM